LRGGLAVLRGALQRDRALDSKPGASQISRQVAVGPNGKKQEDGKQGESG
jgi:hypothetical protein